MPAFRGEQTPPGVGVFFYVRGMIAASVKHTVGTGVPDGPQ